MHFRMFSRHTLVEKDIRHDFVDALSSVGVILDSRELDFGQKPKNDGVPAVKGAIFRAINDFVPYWNKAPLTGVNPVNRELKRALSGISGFPGGKFVLENPGELRDRFAESNNKFFDEFLPGQSFKLEASAKTSDSIPVREVERLVYDLTKSLLSSKVTLSGASLCPPDADYLQDIAIGILNNRRLESQHAAQLLELALRARPEGLDIREQLARANNDKSQN